MESEKLEDLLLLSLSASKGQRERSEVLDVGVTRDKNLREVIVKYSGDIDGLQIPGMEIQKLLAGYAIVKLPEDQIGALVAAREIEYVEMPKNLQTGLYEAKRVSCILPLLSQGDEGALLDGKGVLIAVLDSGIDYRMPDFRKEDGSSRILALWDQELEREFSQEQIDEALQAESRDGRWSLCRASTARTWNGGGGDCCRAIKSPAEGAPGAGLLVVKLSQKQNGYPHTTQLMSAVSWSLSKAAKIGQPLVINISYGNCYGPHDGSSLLCRFLTMRRKAGGRQSA
ncbi:MAG: S8 family serine peptidase [Gallintestinimicrobium sp.]